VLGVSGWSGARGGESWGEWSARTKMEVCLRPGSGEEPGEQACLRDNRIKKRLKLSRVEPHAGEVHAGTISDAGDDKGGDKSRPQKQANSTEECTWRLGVAKLLPRAIGGAKKRFSCAALFYHYRPR
jgi:hypothetical protein